MIWFDSYYILSEQIAEPIVEPPHNGIPDASGRGGRGNGGGKILGLNVGDHLNASMIGVVQGIAGRT
jgi:hypothetical protein